MHAHIKPLKDATSRMKEMTVPQAFLSSQHNTHQNANKTAHNFVARKKRASRTLSRIFWQQKYFLENLVLERSALAPENFSHLFAKPDSQIDSAPSTFSSPYAATSRRFIGTSKMENETAERCAEVTPRTQRRLLQRCSDAELGLQQVVHHLRIHLAAG